MASREAAARAGRGGKKASKKNKKGLRSSSSSNSRNGSSSSVYSTSGFLNGASSPPKRRGTSIASDAFDAFLNPNGTTTGEERQRRAAAALRRAAGDTNREALRWYRVAAECGDPEAAKAVGEMHWAAGNDEEALRWFGVAARRRTAGAGAGGRPVVLLSKVLTESLIP